MKHSKRYQTIKAKIDTNKKYTIDEALNLLKEQPVKFDAGIELHLKLGIDPSKSEQTVRSTVTMPHGTGKTKRVAAFVEDAKTNEAKEAGVDIIGTDEFIAEIKKTSKCDFDIAVATPMMMKKIGQIAKILGQQGLMPNPKTETVGANIGEMIKAIKRGKTTFRSDDGGNLHQLVGRVSFTNDQLAQNIRTFVEGVKRAKPAEAKGTYIVNAVLTSSMGPGIKVQLD